jgi:thioredoxin-like negative regulator of GroEL
VLVLLVLALAPAFAATAAVVAAHREQQVTLARQWRERAEAALQEGNAASAILSLRNALRFAREDRELRLRLARALASAGRAPEARAYLIGLWEDQPGNGPVNLELARLAAGERQLDEAHRFYTNAIQGAWASAAPAQRRAVRLELAETLVAEGANELAQAELIALGTDLPPDRAQQVRVASLLARAGAPRRALTIYEQILRAEPGFAAARVGAGTAAFAVGDVATAARHLRAAVRGGVTGEPADLLAVAQAALELDPHRRGLSLASRAARTRRVLATAAARLERCGPDNAALQPLADELATLMKSATRRTLANAPERIDEMLQAATRAEQAAAGCATPSPEDRAVLLIGARLEGSGL